MTYQTAKILINSGRITREHMLSCLDIFLMAGRVTPEEYTELLLLLPEPPAPDVAPSEPIPDPVPDPALDGETPTEEVLNPQQP